MDFPRRRWLNHQTPAWVTNPDFFITLCTVPHGTDQLCQPGVAEAVMESFVHRHENHVWYVWACVVMPDHVHAIISPADDVDLTRSVANFKRWLARQKGISWQRGFLDHRIRNYVSLSQYCLYIRENPIRAGLVSEASDWAFYWEGSGTGGCPSRPISPNIKLEPLRATGRVGDNDTDAFGRDAPERRPHLKSHEKFCGLVPRVSESDISPSIA